MFYIFLNWPHVCNKNEKKMKGEQQRRKRAKKMKKNTEIYGGNELCIYVILEVECYYEFWH